MMDNYNYYPVHTGPPPTMMNSQADCSMMSGSMTPNSIMHPSPAPSTPHSMRHTPDLPSMQQHHPMVHHHQQQPTSQPNYHQLPPHPVSHSASPHPSSTPHSQGQHPPRPATGPSPLHHQMPLHVNGHSPKISPNPMPMHSPNLMPHGGPMHSTIMAGSSHHHSQHLHHPSRPSAAVHGHGYHSNPIPPNGSHHYGQSPTGHQGSHAPPLMNLGSRPISNGPMMGSGPPPPPSGYMPPHLGHQERSSPFHQNMPKSEFRMIELNKRLQSRPRVKSRSSPLPHFGSTEESDWWERFACDFFDDEATLTLRIPSTDVEPTEYNISRTLIPRFFKSYFDGGVTDLSIKLRNIREVQQHPNLTTLDCDQADIITKNGVKHASTNLSMYVVVEGHLRLEFVNNSSDNLVIKSWRFFVAQCHEYIDRSMTNTGIPPAYLAEPATRFGLTKSTCAYLKMCLVMQPMQDLMTHYKQTKLDPRTCLKQLLYDRYKITNVEEKSVQPLKKRRRTKATAEASAPINKRVRASANTKNNTNAMSNSSGLMAEADPGIQHIPRVAQDVLVLGEPSMLGADFSDENERRITRLENNQYDSSMEESDQQASILGIENQTDQISIPSATMNQEQPSDNACHLTHSDGQGGMGEGVQSVSEFRPNNNLADACTDNQSGIINNDSNELNFDNSINSNNDNYLQGNKDLTTAGDTNHQTNSYAMNGETNHIKSETDLQHKQSTSPLGDDSSRPVSEEPSEKENNGSVINEDSSNATQCRTHLNILNEIPEDREDTCKLSSDIGLSKLPPSVNKVVVTTNGTSTKQNRRRSSERKETFREGLMRTSDFVVSLKDLKYEHPSLWRITTGNNLLQQFEPKTLNGTTLYENTNQYAGWNTDIRKEYVGVDVKLTQHTRNQITVERLLLNFQKLEDSDAFYDKHFLIYLQILISTALDPKFWDGIETDSRHHDYFLTSRKIIDDIIKRHKTTLAGKLKLSEATMKNFEKYPSLSIESINSDKQGQPCRACNTNLSTQNVSFGDRSYDLHSYKPVKVTSELTTIDNKDNEIHLCDTCLTTVKLYSEVHHLGWRLFNSTLEKIEQLRSKGKPVNTILDDCLTDDEWINKNYAERDSLWSRIDRISKQ